MIIGIGLDIIEVPRIKRALENRRFLAKVYSEAEQEYLLKKNLNPQSAAGIFAAKEAVAKALGTGLGTIAWADIEILKEDSGKPYCRLRASARDRLRDIGGLNVFVSITHLKELAAAQAVVEG